MDFSFSSPRRYVFELRNAVRERRRGRAIRTLRTPLPCELVRTRGIFFPETPRILRWGGGASVASTGGHIEAARLSASSAKFTAWAAKLAASAVKLAA